MEALDNLVRANKLQRELFDEVEFVGMLRAGDNKLNDASFNELSDDSQFTLAYGAAYSFSLAALRWHGYRADSRYIVFQCLQHTLALDRVKWRILDKCHNARNRAEYEGQLEVNPQLLNELLNIAREVQGLVKELK